MQFKKLMNITSFTNEQSLYQRMLKFKESRLYAGGVLKELNQFKHRLVKRINVIAFYKNLLFNYTDFWKKSKIFYKQPFFLFEFVCAKI